MIIEDMDNFFENHIEAFKEVVEQMDCNGKFFPTDLYTYPIMNRAMAINHAYYKLAKSNNYIAAAPYIRMQLDNCIHCYAGCLVKDVLGLINYFLKGKDLCKYRGKTKNQLHNKYIVQELNKIFKNFKQAYEYYNDDIHLSHRHFMQSNYMVGGKMRFGINQGSYYDKKEANCHDRNMWIINKWLVTILLNSWLKHKKSQLEVIQQKLEIEHMHMNDIMKELLGDYPEIIDILKRRDRE